MPANTQWIKFKKAYSDGLYDYQAGQVVLLNTTRTKQYTEQGLAEKCDPPDDDKKKKPEKPVTTTKK